MRSKHIVILFPLAIALLLLACGCRALKGISPSTPSSALPSATASFTLAPSRETEATPTPIQRTDCTALEAEVVEQMEIIEDQVVTLRGLRPTGPVQRVLLTQEDLRQRVVEDLLAEYGEQQARDDALLFSMLGLLQSDFDLWNFYADLYSEQIAGYYDDERKEMTVVCGSRFGGAERLTYAHEYTHALQDQNFDLRYGLAYNDEACEADSERCAAIQSLIEGDATLLEEQWLRTYASEQDWDDLLEFFDTFESPVFDSAPRFIRQDLLFPYMAGRSFVQDAYLEGSWAAVDRLYVRPPASTEHILHPERYPQDLPVRLEVPALGSALGEGWRPLDRDVMGEWYTQLVLNEQLPKAEAVDAAAGWGGDVYLAFHHPTQKAGVLVLVSQWDTMHDVHEFFQGLLEYSDLRFGERESSTPYKATWSGDQTHALLERASNQTVWILTPDAGVTQTLREALPFPARPLP